MKNILNVKRLNDNRNRIYALPDGVAVTAGQLVKVQTGYGEALGIALKDNYPIADEVEAMFRYALNITDSFMKVLAVYSDPDRLDWPDDGQDDTEDPSPDDDDE